MKNTLLFVSLFTLFLLCGCSSQKLNIGVYQSIDSSRDDMAMVYEDMIILQVKSPENAEGALAYWTWGGKYSYDDDGQIILKMDEETRKRWNFYYNFIGRKDGIVINDLTRNSGLVLRYTIPKRRNTIAAPVPVGSTGVDPDYQYIHNN